MIDDSLLKKVDSYVHRFANPISDYSALQELGFEHTEIQNALKFLRDLDALYSEDELLDVPFRNNYTLIPNLYYGRFSDGSIRIFYAALEPETAQAEVTYHFVRYALGNGSKQRVAFYKHIRCRFAGTVADLRSKVQEWHFLTGDQSYYEKCQELTRKAMELRLDGFYTPSARKEEGTNVPIFKRETLSSIEIISDIAFLFDNNTGLVKAMQCYDTKNSDK